MPRQHVVWSLGRREGRSCGGLVSCNSLRPPIPRKRSTELTLSCHLAGRLICKALIFIGAGVVFCRHSKQDRRMPPEMHMALAGIPVASGFPERMHISYTIIMPFLTDMTLAVHSPSRFTGCRASAIVGISRENGFPEWGFRIAAQPGFGGFVKARWQWLQNIQNIRA